MVCLISRPLFTHSIYLFIYIICSTLLPFLPSSIFHITPSLSFDLCLKTSLPFDPIFFTLLTFFLEHTAQSFPNMVGFFFRSCLPVRECELTHTHRSAGLCCPTAIHHHFISLNWMPSGPLILRISTLTNSCSLHTQKNSAQSHTLS